MASFDGLVEGMELGGTQAQLRTGTRINPSTIRFPPDQLDQRPHCWARSLSHRNCLDRAKKHLAGIWKL